MVESNHLSTKVLSMRRMIFFSILFFSLISCLRDTNPINSTVDNDGIIINSTGQSQDGIYKFKISNTQESSVWYLGYQEHSPIYTTQVLSDTGWVYSGLGWCGTGLMKIEFNPGDSFMIDVKKPDTNRPWRAGILIYINIEDNDRYSWSNVIY